MLRLVFLRLGVRDSYVEGLVLLRLGVRILTFGGWFSLFGGLVFFFSVELEILR